MTQEIIGWGKVLMDMVGVTDAIRVALYVLIGLYIYHKFFNKD